MTVFLPCRSGSQRIPNKNTKDFAGIKGGLLTIKLKTLLNVSNIDKIVVSSNDFEVIRIAKSFNSSKIEIDFRPEHLATSETSTDELINYVPTIIDDEHILWTHVTSPFIAEVTFERAIEKFFIEDQFDSLMTVNKIQTFLWDENGPINYDRDVEKWPRTQTLPLIFEVNSGFFINTRQNYIKYGDRIGKHPFLYVTNGFESVDIDWPDDFLLGEMIYRHKFVN
ncbi:acylneuraminate cytidylyltransferase family protein [Mangrovimonas xylaniphaga]|uniref:acylneuraminate cytidylyltransferase family protein n=1 Tax=Mangrovimonas xylaniphaga TaxID=1645915 RepID=UPI0006B63CCB|nr:acylneuraminate cytidylyltransferase family protein [Mangrovimonas xylaniphaga]